ncbi:dynein heavy chain [Kipferlia bialata]|uniref:Dynein heavy chain n=1 Tax=Kipferlia bialata TaxID=797122 RepID=A0A9K3GGB2_9EUKA|nr:dynein heavy chain [Kipferlia bialata]|eukprot:g2886.t1
MSLALEATNMSFTAAELEDIKKKEEEVLCRALRDFNIPKIVLDDLEIFLGLIGDLFPGVDVPRLVNEDLEATIKRVTVESGLQAEDSFILKVVQLEELLEVRHSVFILGDAGVGKTQCWKMLAKTYQDMGRKILHPVINPKAVTTKELYGYIMPATREWKDGLFSNTMRTLSNIANTEPKWIVLDGDVDTIWIESLNTVMDDNKMLTLASNERVPLHPHMRLLFEVGQLTHASPATVSRAGILFINQTDVGWSAYVQSWIRRR